MKTEKDIIEEIYDKYKWVIDDVNPKTRFAEFEGWMNKGVLDENKIVRIHNKDLREALQSQKQKIIEEIEKWFNEHYTYFIGIEALYCRDYVKRRTKELLKTLGEKQQ